MRTKKIILYLLLAFNISSIVTVNIRGLLTGYYGFYYTRDAVHNNPVYSSLSFVEDFRPLSLLLSYTGLETGYGFFAPNVASDFIVELECYDSAGNRLPSTKALTKTKEGFLRMNTASSMFLDYMKPDSLSIERQKCKVFLKGICMRIMEQDQRIASMTAKVYLYHHPLLSDFRINKDQKPSYVLYETQTYSAAIAGSW